MFELSLWLVTGRRHAQACLAVIVVALLASGSFAETPQKIEAAAWRSERLVVIAQKIESADSDEERLEQIARQAWLRRWKPGHMPSAPSDWPDESDLVDEPLLGKLKTPDGVALESWQRTITLQKRLLTIDNDEERKENLRETIELAGKLEQCLSQQLSAESQALQTRTGWALAYARYRLGRGLAYRELPVVRQRWPIANPERYEQQLNQVYARLTKQISGSRPEFILLEDRMLRRTGKKGRALQLLEANKRFIEPKWYLKKRRDLLKELGWEPAHIEAAKKYTAAGFRDET